MTRSDSIRKDAPAGKNELALLQSIKLGEVRKDLLFPAIGVPMVWCCTLTSENRWRFEGSFCGEPVVTVDITSNGTAIVLDSNIGAESPECLL